MWQGCVALCKTLSRKVLLREFEVDSRPSNDDGKPVSLLRGRSLLGLGGGREPMVSQLDQLEWRGTLRDLRIVF